MKGGPQHLVHEDAHRVPGRIDKYIYIMLCYIILYL